MEEVTFLKVIAVTLTIVAVIAILSAWFLSKSLLLLNHRLDRIERNSKQSEVRMLESITITMFNTIDALSNKKDITNV